MKKFANAMRWFFAVVFILGGVSYAKTSIATMVLAILLGVSLIPLTWKVIPAKKWIRAAVPFLLLVMVAMVTPTSQGLGDNIYSTLGAASQGIQQKQGTGAQTIEKITEVAVLDTEAQETAVPETEQVVVETGMDQEEIQTPEKRTEAEPETASTDDISLTMDVIDVGQGLSLLFESDGQYLLYDGGDRDYSSKVVSFLKRKNVQSLEYIIVSHYDADHLNGVVGALNVFDVKHVIGPDYSTDTRVYQSFVDILGEKNLEKISPSVGETYTLGSASFTVLAPNQSVYGDENDYSVSIRISCGDQSVMVTGDATVSSESEMLENGQDLDAEILVVGHHGSEGSTSEAFLDRVSPAMAVISCGKDNMYLHPSQRVMELLEGKQIPVYRTDKQGDLQFILDGKNIQCSAEPSWDYSYGIAEDVPSERTSDPVEMYATSGVNIRNEKSTDSEVIGQLAVGEGITVNGVDGDWAEVAYQGVTAYIAAAYLSSTKPDTQPDGSTQGTGNVSNFNTYDNDEQQNTSAEYVLNMNTRKFHYPSCSSVKKIAPHNYATSNESRDTLIAQGYGPCGRCNP